MLRHVIMSAAAVARSVENPDEGPLQNEQLTDVSLILCRILVAAKVGKKKLFKSSSVAKCRNG